MANYKVLYPDGQSEDVEPLADISDEPAVDEDSTSDTGVTD